MPVDLTDVRELFFEESFENLDVMESNLLDLEIGTLEKELINSIFRAAHSIKGGAGIFKFEQIIDFAHVTETLLDKMRNGELLITQSMIDLLLRSVDVMRMMLSAQKENTDYEVQEVRACQDELQKLLDQPSLEKILNGETAAPIPPTTPNVSPPLTNNPEPQSPTVATNEGWHIVFKPDLSMLKTGNDPINLFHELSQLGNLELKVDTSQIPTFSELDPQSCYLNWELFLHGDIERTIIEEIFEWVEEDCDLHINALSATPSDKTTLVNTSLKPEVEKSPPETKENQEIESSPLKTQLKENQQLKHSPSPTKAEEEPSQPEPLLNGKEPAETITVDNQTRVLDDKPLEPKPQPAAVKVSEAIESHSTAADVLSMSKTPIKETLEIGMTNDNSGHTLHGSHHSTEANSIRVGIDKIDILINMVGELVITQSMLDQVGENFDNSRITQLRDGLSQLERNTRELQESVMRIRMLPIGYSFNRFPRLVHDLSVQLGKKVELKLSGEHTELDKTVLEKMSDPLVHLVRNALDHGVETPEQRRAIGKPETGQLHLHAFHQGGNIIIQISDDGAGFDLEKIRTKAIEKGLLNAEEHVTEEQLYEFVFHPGLSTATQVSDLSGRGVGMDVVRRNIRSLGGTIEVQSKPGQGSTFTIRLPLTLAILDGQLVRVGQQIYILSLLSIVESLRVKPSLVNSLAGKAEVYKLRDDYIPILRLYTLFDITPSTTQLEEGLLVIVEGDGQKIGLFVDELLSQQQIVIKSLETNYQQVQGISGATILGDGSVALILDTAGLIHLFHTHSQTQLSSLASIPSQEFCYDEQ